ncbi:MAG TPA: hypothetical protein VEY51_13690, partial [Chondromyces sp.]|nr:hypothetical protein [Chondromyces sp.]
KKRSKKPFIFGFFGVLLVAVIAVGVYIQHDTKQKEEMWAFRDTLDQTYFPLREEFEACVYPENSSSKEEYDCYVLDLLERNQEVRERISAYEVSSEDAKKLKNEVLNGLDIINRTTDHLDDNDGIVDKNGTLTSDEAKTLAENISNLKEDEKDFYDNADRIYDIFVPKYYSE